jgi:hypothetical protein
MTMAEVTSHTIGQLEMIYGMAVRERASEKIIDLNILIAVVSAAVSGKNGGINQVRQILSNQVDGGIKNQNPKKNRASVVQRLMMMGAKKKS